ISPDLIETFKGGLVDWRSAGIDRDIFMLFAGLEVDAHIGNLSGGSAFLYVTDIPGLMLNAWAMGDALPRTTVHYKDLRDRDGTLGPLSRLFTEFFYDLECKGYRRVDAAPAELAEAVS